MTVACSVFIWRLEARLSEALNLGKHSKRLQANTKSRARLLKEDYQMEGLHPATGCLPVFGASRH